MGEISEALLAGQRAIGKIARDGSWRSVYRNDDWFRSPEYLAQLFPPWAIQTTPVASLDLARRLYSAWGQSPDAHESVDAFEYRMKKAQRDNSKQIQRSIKARRARNARLS